MITYTDAVVLKCTNSLQRIGDDSKQIDILERLERHGFGVTSPTISNSLKKLKAWDYVKGTRRLPKQYTGRPAGTFYSVTDKGLLILDKFNKI